MLKRLLCRAREMVGAQFCAGAAAILMGAAAVHGAATIQDFSSATSGTPYTAQQLGDAPGPIISGGFATVVSDSGGQRNYFTFDSTGINSSNGPILIYFDYRMPTEASHTGCCGERADGFGFALMDTAVHGTTGPVGDVWGAVEQDAIAGAFTIGFDIFTGAGSDGAVNDNTVRIGLNGTTVAFREFGPGFKLNNGSWNRVAAKITASGADLILDLSITPQGSTQTVVFAGQVIPNATIPTSRVVYAGRTGGAFVKLDVDNLQAYSDFPVNTPASITAQPVDVAVTETLPAAFSISVTGTPPFMVQWYSNGVAIPNADQLSYGIPVTTTNMNGTVFRASVSNEFTGTAILSDPATLTVSPGLLVRRVTTLGYPDKIFIDYIKPVSLGGTYTVDNGVTVNSAAYGSSQSQVVLTTTPLTPNTAYQVTIAGETGQDTSALLPDPTVASIYHGFGGFCTDFAALPAGSATFGAAGGGFIGDDGSTTNNVLHVTDAVNGQAGAFVVSNVVPSGSLDRLYANFRMYIGDGTCCGGNFADGLSFNWAAGLPFATLGGAEEGTGTGLTVAFDTWDNGGGEAPAIDIKWGGQLMGSVKMPIVRNGTNFVPVNIAVDPDGTLDLSYDGIQVYNNLVLTNYAPISNSRIGIYARTGGANENAWIDDLCVNNFTIGPVSIAQNPADTTVLEGNRATFTVTADGTPPYLYQWFTNGVAVAGATSQTFRTAPTTGDMDNLQVSVVVSNAFSSATSTAAILDVNLSPRVVSVFAPNTTTVRVRYTRPVELDGTYEFNGGIFAGDIQYGANQSEIVITTDPLTPLTPYQLTITDVHSLLGDTLLPNPTVVSFHQGYGAVCANFDDNTTPEGWIVRANAGTATRVADGFVHLTDAANSLNGTFFIPDQNAGLPMDRLLMSFRLQMSHPVPGTRMADGASLSIGSDVTAAANPGEEGVGSGLVITLDTWDNNGADTAPAFEVRYKGTVVAMQAAAGLREGGRAPAGPFMLDAHGNPVSLDTSNAWINVILSVSPEGKLDFYYGDVKVFSNVQLPNYTPFVGANYSFGARTGGANENVWIDDLCINSFSFGVPTITQQPVSVVANEPGSATFTVSANGTFPYSFQWYSNGVAIAGAIGPNYQTPVYDRVADGWQYRVVVSNSEGSVTSQVATLTFNRDEVAPTVLTAQADCSGNVFVRFSEPVQPASATNTAFYSVSGGGTVNAAELLGANWVRLSVTPAPAPGSTTTLTVNGVRDALGYNAANTTANYTVNYSPIASSGTMIVVEAEDYDLNLSPARQTPTSSWYLSNSLTGFTGTGYMDAVPNTGAFGGDTPDLFTNASALAYCIDVPAAGRYYIWARGSSANDGGNNSFHLGIDGVSSSDFSRRIGNATQNWGTSAADINAFGWVRDSLGGAAAYIDIATPGTHTLNIWMREDGLKLDKIILTTDAAFTLAPTDIGPAGTVRRGAGPRLSIGKAADGTVTITWPGTGFTLQGTPGISNPPAITPWQNLPFTSPVVIPPGFFPTPTNLFFRLISTP